MTKFGMELNKYVVIHKLENVETKNKKIGGKVIKCWFGISPKKDNAGEEED